MEFFTVLHSRRSVREFTGEPVAEEHIQVLLDAAMIAPSAGNARPWRFIVVTDRALLSSIPRIHPYAAMAQRAPLAIIICADTQAEKYPGFWVQDVAAATQNMLLAARALGLGAVWTGVYPVEERVVSFQKMFGTPEHVLPFSCVVIGHTTVLQQEKSRLEPGCVHRNKW